MNILIANLTAALTATSNTAKAKAKAKAGKKHSKKAAPKKDNYKAADKKSVEKALNFKPRASHRPVMFAPSLPANDKGRKDWKATQSHLYY